MPLWGTWIWIKHPLEVPISPPRELRLTVTYPGPSGYIGNADHNSKNSFLGLNPQPGHILSLAQLTTKVCWGNRFFSGCIGIWSPSSCRGALPSRCGFMTWMGYSRTTAASWEEVFTGAFSQLAHCLWRYCLHPPLIRAHMRPGVNAACRLRGLPFASPRKDEAIEAAEVKVFSLLSQGLCEPGNKRSKASLQTKVHSAN